MSFLTVHRFVATLDADDCIRDILEVIQVPQLLSYAHNSADHIHQIFLSEIYRKELALIVSLQTVFENSLKSQDVMLQKISEGVLIIKLPVSAGVRICNSLIVPNPELSVKTERDGNILMALQSVICLKDNHYTIFSCDETTKSWMFLDSSPTDSQPYVCNTYIHLIPIVSLSQSFIEYQFVIPFQ